jgi:hypothetical protein
MFLFEIPRKRVRPLGKQILDFELDAAQNAWLAEVRG